MHAILHAWGSKGSFCLSAFGSASFRVQIFTFLPLVLSEKQAGADGHVSRSSQSAHALVAVEAAQLRL